MSDLWGRMSMGAIAGVIGETDRGLVARMLGVMRAGEAGPPVYASYGASHAGMRTRGAQGRHPACRAASHEALDRCVLFDGYIANSSELRGRLRDRGHAFGAGSDAETALRLAEEYGDDFPRLIDGDFALSVVGDDYALLARDRFGVRPLYYLALEESNLFLFASEIKALLQYADFTPRLDEEKMTDLVVPSYPVGAQTFIEGVRSVRPGHTLSVRRDEGGLRIEEKEYSGLRIEPDDSMTLGEARDRLAGLLAGAVGSRLPDGGGAGLALSGGVDSTLIALTARRHSPRHLNTFTVSSSPEHPDVQMARATAELVGAEHHELIISFEDYLAAVPAFVAAMERPLLYLGTPFYLLCREVAPRARVCLIGEAADPVFGGGVDYFFDKRVCEELGKGLERARALGLRVREEVSAIVSDLCQTDGHERYLSNYFRRRLTDIFFAGVQSYHASAASCGVEVRDPYLSLGLVEFLGSVPFRLKVERELLIDKYLLRYTGLSMFGSEMLEAVLCQKRGLGGPFRGYGERFRGLCAEGVPDRYVEGHRFGAHLPEKQHLVLLDLFELIFIENRGAPPAGLDVREFIRSRGEAPAARAGVGGGPARRDHSWVAADD